MADLRERQDDAARALEFTILTAARTSETIGARLGEIDRREKSWKVPGERMKAGREHRVPLSKRAFAIVEASRSTHDDFVFEGRKPNTSLSNMAMLKLLERMGRSDLTVHGFRSTFRDWAAERTNFPNEVVEMALAHIVDDKTEAAYRRGDLFDKRRGLMDAWADFCASERGGKVVALRRKS
jgi:integrase